jgi:hypothetical protein
MPTPSQMPTAPEPQVTSAVLMIRPLRFGWNAETAASNTYQVPTGEPAAELQARAAAEWDALRERLVTSGVAVTAFDDRLEPHTPDSIFPNNWFSTHADGTLVLYPMAAENRRAERRPHLIAALQASLGVRRVVDLTSWEAQGKFLEGTGSLVLDRAGRVAYAAPSVRTHPEVAEAFCAALGYRLFLFDTVPRRGQPAYHTNVVLSLGETAAVVCPELIDGAAARAGLVDSLARSGRDVIPINVEQVDAFAGNLLQLRGRDDELLWVLSSAAHAALRPEQRDRLARRSRLVHSPLPTIESVGGGSARCMLAELFSSRD